MGRDRVELYIHRGFVSRLSTPLNALVSSWAKEGCVTWEDVDIDVFSRFAQFLYTGDYTGFAPADSEDTSRHSEEASATAQPGGLFGSTALWENSATTQSASLFGNQSVSAALLYARILRTAQTLSNCPTLLNHTT